MAKNAPTLFADEELAPMPEKLCTDALAVWNEIAPGASWPEARFLTQSRRTAMRRAIKDYGGLVGWKEHLARAATSDFLTGKSPRGEQHKDWRPDLDWFLKPANVVKILENKFSGKGPAKSSVFANAKPQGIDWRGTLERYKPRGFWHKDTMGPRPEESGPHKVPADMIEAWRKKHGITGVQAPTETREQRLAASIATFRRLGDYARANAAEEQLAALQGRPPELVPAPDARNPDVVPPKMPSNKGYSGHTAKNGGNYSKSMQRSEAEITRAMAAAQDAAWEDIPEGENYGRDE